jgi:hypothetical protein
LELDDNQNYAEEREQDYAKLLIISNEKFDKAYCTMNELYKPQIAGPNFKLCQSI